MDCSGIAELISPLLDGELKGDEADKVTAHVDKCAACSEIVQGHQTVKRLITEKLPFHKASPRLRSAVRQQIGPRSHQGAFSIFLRGLRPKPLIASGVATLLVIGLTLAVIFTNSPRVPPLLLQLVQGHAEANQAPLEFVGASTGDIATQISRVLKRQVVVADLDSRWCFLIGARRCPRCNNPSVEIRYYHPAGRLSLFMLSGVNQKAVAKLCKSGSLHKREVNGATYLTCRTDCGRVVLWMDGEDAYVVKCDFSLPAVCPFEIAGDIREVCSRGQ